RTLHLASSHGAFRVASTPGGVRPGIVMGLERSAPSRGRVFERRRSRVPPPELRRKGGIMRRASLFIAMLIAIQTLRPGASTASAKSVVVTVTSMSPDAVAAFHEARDLLDNVRVAEGAAGMKRAIEIDADFALAHAYLGSVTPGAEGLKELETANRLAAK